MSKEVEVDYHLGEKLERKPVDLSLIIEGINERTFEIVDWPIEELIEIIDLFGKQLIERSNEIHKKYPRSGIPFIANWCQRKNLEAILNFGLNNYRLLDSFVESEVQPDRSYRLYPKGLIVHWMAGNVPTLAFLSMIQGILTKNVNIIKLPSSSNSLLADLLSEISEIKKGYRFSGQELVKTISVIRYEHSRRDIGEYLSQHADIRIFWGSDEAVQEMKKLPTKIDTTDVVYPNRTSLMLIGNKAFKDCDTEKLVRRIASDISIFEQKACASPHTLFLETENDSDIDFLAESLVPALKSALRAIPKTVPSQKEVLSILNLRAQYDILHKAWYSEGTEFTLLSDDLFQLGPAIGNRTLFLRKIKKLDDVAKLIVPSVQSIGILADDEQFAEVTRLLGNKGVCRFTRIGMMTHFETPWDGLNLLNHLVRWTSRPGQILALESK